MQLKQALTFSESSLDALRVNVDSLNAITPFKIFGETIYHFDADRIRKFIEGMVALGQDKDTGVVDPLDYYMSVMQLSTGVTVTLPSFQQDLETLDEGDLLKKTLIPKFHLQKMLALRGVMGPRALRNIPPLDGTFLNWPFIDVAAGSTMLIGGTGSGKSTLLAQGFSPDVIIRMAEPYESVDLDPKQMTMCASDIPSLVALVVGLSALNVSMGIDSIRKIAYEMDGAAGSQGLKATLFTTLTDFNNFCSLLYINVPVVLNPNSKDEAALYAAYEAAGGASAAVILIQEGKIVESMIRRAKSRSALLGTDPVAKSISKMSNSNNAYIEEKGPRSLSLNMMDAHDNLELNLSSTTIQSQRVDEDDLDSDHLSDNPRKGIGMDFGL